MMSFMNFQRTPDFSIIIEKKNNGTLVIEDILNDNDVVNYIKINSTKLKDM